jgi:hypothetical protein
VERFLLLWDELDELVGAARHAVAMSASGFAGASREAFGHVGSWFEAGSLSGSAAFRGVTREP